MALPVILIPAYKPDHQLPDFIRLLKEGGFQRILVVDDGSLDNSAGIFGQAVEMGCTVLKHAINMGKGRALKTGLNYCLIHHLDQDGVITADADGQHAVADVEKIAAAMAANPEAMVLGVRQFTGRVPLRNRLGNGITRFFFGLIHGQDVKDTQSGLRGIPSAHMRLFLSLSGERYEYEMNMLLAVKPNDIRLIQIPIETIYIEGNTHSHYNVWRDSFRIYRLLFKFIGSSAIATMVDYLLFTLMNLSFPDQVFYSIAVARAVSSTVNFSINRTVVFKKKDAPKSAIIRYYGLALTIMLASYALIKFFSEIAGINIYVSKVMADALLTTISFIIQREFVYRKIGVRQPKP